MILGRNQETGQLPLVGETEKGHRQPSHSKDHNWHRGKALISLSLPLAYPCLILPSKKLWKNWKVNQIISWLLSLPTQEDTLQAACPGSKSQKNLMLCHVKYLLSNF